LAQKNLGVSCDREKFNEVSNLRLSQLCLYRHAIAVLSFGAAHDWNYSLEYAILMAFSHHYFEINVLSKSKQEKYPRTSSVQKMIGTK
jgi:hypothetical protein